MLQTNLEIAKYKEARKHLPLCVGLLFNPFFALHLVRNRSGKGTSRGHCQTILSLDGPICPASLQSRSIQEHCVEELQVGPLEFQAQLNALRSFGAFPDQCRPGGIRGEPKLILWQKGTHSRAYTWLCAQSLHVRTIS